MNYSTAVFLINKTVRAVNVSYERDSANPERYSGTLTMFKTFDQSIKKGDFVIVPTDTRWRMTVCRVEEVDVDVDLESTVQVGWLIGRVDKVAYEGVLAQEETAVVAIKSAEKKRKQDELRDALLKDNPELNSLATVGLGAAALAAPPTPAYNPAPPPPRPDDIQF